MKYISTRGQSTAKTFDQILLSGLAEDGGLYLPETTPVIDAATQHAWSKLSYKDLATEVFSLFAGSSIDKALIQESADVAYAKFNHSAIAPLKQLDSQLWLLELFHGPTVAFKDYAMQLLGEVIERVLAKNGQSITIICATSGDTGAAAANAFANRKNIRMVVLHPHERVSPVQRKQMTTLDADNVVNLAVNGSFDDCQTLVKEMFGDAELSSELNLTGVNSINWARICSQIVYYIYSSLRINNGHNVNYVVPTGNFGNIFAAHMAKKMGFPIGGLAQSSNENDVLPRFFKTGKMELNGVHQTISPSMDIQISSNFERYLFELKNKDGAALNQLQQDLKTKSGYQVSAEELAIANSHFSAIRCDKDQAVQEIKDTFEQTGEILCPHTATAVFAAKAEMANNPLFAEGNTVAVATAHAAKFQAPIVEALGYEAPYPLALQSVLDGEEKFDIIDDDANVLKQRLLAK